MLADALLLLAASPRILFRLDENAHGTLISPINNGQAAAFPAREMPP